MSNIDKQALRQLAVDAKELAIIKRYTKGIEAQKKFIAVMTPATVLALLDELEAKDKRNERALSLLSDANTENVWEIIGRLKTVISDDYRSEPEIAAAVKGE